MIKSQHNKPYKHKMHSNKVDYSTAAGPYYTTHNVKVPFFYKFSSIKIILYHFSVNKN